MTPSENAQVQIDMMLKKRGDEEPAISRIIRYARRGLNAPEALSHKEIQQICFAMVAHYPDVACD